MERSRSHLLHEHRILLFEQPDVLPPSLDTRHANMLDLGDLLLDNRLTPPLDRPKLLDNRLPPPLDRPKLLDTRQPLLLDIPKLLDSPRLPPLDRPKRLDNRRPPPLDNARQPVFLQNPPTITQPYSEKKTPSTWRRDNQRFISWCYKRNPTPPHGLPRVQIPPSHPADPATPAVSDPLQAATPPQGLPRVQIPPPHQAAAASVSADMLQAATPEPQERPPPPSPPLLRPRKRSRCIEQVDGCLDEGTSEEETSEEETSKDKGSAASSSPAKEQQQLILMERLLAEKKIDKRFEEFMEEIRNSHV